jgi:hypothetical protein
VDYPQAPIAAEKPGGNANHHAAPHCRLLFNIAHIPGELATDRANLPCLVYRKRSVAALDPGASRNLSRKFRRTRLQNDVVRGFWTEQYCSAKRQDTDQYAGSQSRTKNLETQLTVLGFLRKGPLRTSCLDTRAEAA